MWVGVQAFDYRGQVEGRADGLKGERHCRQVANAEPSLRSVTGRRWLFT